MHQNQIEDFLERIRQTESLSENKFARFFTDFKIERTSAYQGVKNKYPLLTDKEFKPDTYFKAFTLLGITALKNKG